MTKLVAKCMHFGRKTKQLSHIVVVALSLDNPSGMHFRALLLVYLLEIMVYHSEIWR